MAKKGQTKKKYSAEFKISVILDMREHGLGYREQQGNTILVVQTVKARILFEIGSAYI
mgnify:FL=1